MKNYLTPFESLFDNFFPVERSYSNDFMTTDIKETYNGYLMNVDLPNIKKENIKVSVDNGYLTINVCYEENKDEYLLNERRTGEYSRSYYFGEGLKLKNIKASLKNGVLNLFILKEKEHEPKYVEIN